MCSVSAAILDPAPYPYSFLCPNTPIHPALFFFKIMVFFFSLLLHTHWILVSWN